MRSNVIWYMKSEKEGSKKGSGEKFLQLERRVYCHISANHVDIRRG